MDAGGTMILSESCQKSHKYDRVAEHIPEDMDLEGLNLTQVLRLAGL